MWDLDIDILVGFEWKKCLVYSGIVNSGVTPQTFPQCTGYDSKGGGLIGMMTDMQYAWLLKDGKWK